MPQFNISVSSKSAGSIGKSSQDGYSSLSGADTIDASDVKSVLVNKVEVKRHDTTPTSGTTTPETPKDGSLVKVLDGAESQQTEQKTTPVPLKEGAPAKTLGLGANKQSEATTTAEPPKAGAPGKINVKRNSFMQGTDDMPIHNIEKRGQGKNQNGVSRIKKRG